jgi:preprotein translocase subunit SecA
MGFNDILKKLFGNKAQRDLKEIEPWVEKIKQAYETIKILSHDELRGRSEALQQQIRDFVAPEKNRIAELRASIEATEINLREKIYN